MSTRILKKTFGAAFVAAALVLAGCSAESPDSPAATTEPADGGAGGGEAELGELTIALSSSLSTLDVSQSGMLDNYYVAAVSHEGLVGIDENGEIVPALAESWDQPDDRTWVYTLREAQFHDGTPVTVEDVIFSINLARDAELSFSTAYYWPELESVTKTGDREITIVLAETSSTFAWTPSAAAGLFVTSQAFHEAAETYGSVQDLVLGTGPYEVVEFRPDSHVLLERSDTYWGEAPPFESIRFDFIEDINTRLLAYQQGEVDIALSVPADQLAQWQGVEGSQVETVSNLSYQGFTIDPNVEPFDDIHVRRAFAHAIDRESIVSGLLSGLAEPATGITAPGQLALSIGAEEAEAAVASLPVYEYDLDKAREELAQSSVPDGFELEITYLDSIPELGRISLALSEQLADIGITLDVKEITASQWNAEIGDGNHAVAWMSYTPPVPTDWPTDWLLGEWNPANWQNPEVFALIAEGLTATDPAARVETVIDATEIALDEGIYAPVYWGTTTTAFGPRVTATDVTSYYFLTNWTQALEVAE